MQAKAIVGGRLVSFQLSPELARAHSANAGKTMTDKEGCGLCRKEAPRPRAAPRQALVEAEMNSTPRRKGAKSPGKAQCKFSLRLCVFALKKGEMLTVAGLSKAFGGRQLFDDVSLTLLSGERAAILFPQLKPNDFWPATFSSRLKPK